MIDFMANITNKKNMTKCNIKTLMATSVLCVFFNGVLIYGMIDDNLKDNLNINDIQNKKEIEETNQDEIDINNANNINNNIDSINIKNIKNMKNYNAPNPLYNSEKYIKNISQSNDLLYSSNRNFELKNKLLIYKDIQLNNGEESNSEVIPSKDLEDLIIKREKRILNSAFRNYKGEFSLLFCCNWLNGKLEKRQEYIQNNPVSTNMETNRIVYEMLSEKIKEEKRRKKGQREKKGKKIYDINERKENTEEQDTTENNIPLEDSNKFDNIQNKFDNIQNKFDNIQNKDEIITNDEETNNINNKEDNNNK